MQPTRTVTRISARGVLPTVASVGAAALCAALLVGTANAEEIARGTIERIKVHSPSIEGNLQGNSAERDVLVYLPPSYSTDTNRRYPVVYQLHGWLPGAEQWAQMIQFQERTDRAIASGTAKEMIIVLPDSQGIFGGAMYSNSVTSGDFEGSIARDLVPQIDRPYPRIRERRARGRSGHPWGASGTRPIGR